MQNTSWLLVGGGLANALLALRLERISANYLILERGTHLLGGQTWSCQLSDIDPADQELALSLADSRWEEYSVRFPSYSRKISSPYLTLRSESLRQRLTALIPAHKIRLGTEVISTDQTGVETKDGRLEARYVIPALGFGPPESTGGFQKFVGWDLRFEKPHGLTVPLLMDADVEQKDGYRFFYLLPFDEHTMLVEETRYSNSPNVDAADFSAGIQEYLREKFPRNAWTNLREESGSLPIPWQMRSDGKQFGTAGGFFHPSTGYSLPYALRASREIVQKTTAGASAAEALKSSAQDAARSHGYYLMLNRMMFLAAPPLERRKIFERFYGLSEGLIQRFYSGHPTALDKMRMLSGRPPVKISAALRAFTTEVAPWN